MEGCIINYHISIRPEEISELELSVQDEFNLKLFYEWKEKFGVYLNDFGYDYKSLLKLPIDSWDENEIPEWLNKIPITNNKDEF